MRAYDRFLSFDKDYAHIKPMIDMLLEKVPHKKLRLVDVGAFDGKQAIQFLHQHRGSVAFAIEPCRKNVKYLRGLTVPGLRVHRVAITDFCGDVDLHVEQVEKYRSCGLSSQANSVFEDFVQNKSGTQCVRSMTLDVFCVLNHIDRIDVLDINCEGSEFLIFDSTVDFLDKVNIVDLSLHGKLRRFLTPEMIRRKIAISRLLRMHGLVQVCGHNLLESEVVPVDHIRQVWIRREMI